MYRRKFALQGALVPVSEIVANPARYGSTIGPMLSALHRSAMMVRRKFILITSLMIAAVCVSSFVPVYAQTGCGSASDAGGYGPFDYRKDKNKLRLVEVFHFTPEVESLRRGESGYIGGDLD